MKCKIGYASILPSNHLHPILAYLWERAWTWDLNLVAAWSPSPPPSRSNSHRLNLVAAWTLPPLDWSRCLDLIAHDQSRHLDLVTHEWSLSFSIYLSLSLSFRLLFLPPSLSLTKFFSLMNGFVLIFVSLSIFIEIFYYKICLEVEKWLRKCKKLV